MMSGDSLTHSKSPLIFEPVVVNGVPGDSGKPGRRTIECRPPPLASSCRSESNLPHTSRAFTDSAPCSPVAQQHSSGSGQLSESSSSGSLCSSQSTTVAARCSEKSPRSSLSSEAPVTGNPKAIPMINRLREESGRCSGSVPYTRTLMRTVSFNSPRSKEQERVNPRNHGNRFLVGNLIGRGSYAKVRDAYDLTRKTVVAIKIFKWAQLKKVPGGDVSLKRELTALRKVTRHPNCVSLVEFWRDPIKGKSYVALDYMPCGTLEGLLLKAGDHPLPLEQARLLFSGLIAGLKHMHECGVFHRDIKPDNLMLLNNTTLSVSDFGTSTMSTSTEGVGAPAFQPPEVAANGKAPQADKLDVWSAGVTLYIMVTGKYPYPAQMSLVQTFHTISTTEVEIPDDLPPTLQELLRGMLARDPSERYSCEQVAQSAWLTTPDPDAKPETFLMVHPRSTIFTPEHIPRFIHDFAPDVEKGSATVTTTAATAKQVSPKSASISSIPAATRSQATLPVAVAAQQATPTNQDRQQQQQQQEQPLVNPQVNPETDEYVPLKGGKAGCSKKENGKEGTVFL